MSKFLGRARIALGGCRHQRSITSARLRAAVTYAVEPMERRVMLAGNVVINEFMADNATGLKDYYGQNSDWIELRNLDATPRDLSGWHLTDDPANLTEYTFPAGTTIAANGYLLVFASNRGVKAPNGELHTNFKLAAGGDYLGLIDADGTTVVSEYAPQYPQQYADVSYGRGTQPSSVQLVGPGTAGRWFVPTSAAALNPNWAGAGFSDAGWTAGTVGLGYDATAASAGRFAVRESHGASALTNVQDGINLILSGAGTVTDYAASVINFVDPQNPANGRFVGATSFGGNTAVDDNNFALRVRGTIRIATAGQYTFGVNSDDGFSLTLKGATFTTLTGASNATGTDTMSFAGVRSAADTLGVTTLAAGTYEFDLNYFDGGGAAGLEFFAAPGAKTAFDSTFKLVGDTASGGLPLLAVSDALASNPSFQAAAQNVNASAFLRVPFNVTDPADVVGLTLGMKFDDGFVAYLNGQEVARVNAPDTPVWNSAATADRLTGDAVRYESIDLGEFKGLLVGGQNVLAIQALNTSAGDANLLVSPKLDVAMTPQGSAGLRYFVTPTPRAANGTGASDLGPIVTDVSTPKTQPGDNDAIVVTARVRQATNPVTGSPTLVYRVNYNTEVTTTMWDDGPAGGHGDATAGDGVWTGTIPASASTPGQMVRWYVRASDTAGNQGRWPVVVPLVGNDAGPEYVGTVIANPGLTSTLPIFEWFTQDVAGANGAGARGSVFYLGEFYDNVFIRKRGANSTNGNKFEFNSGYDFKYANDRDRVKEINVNGRGSLDDAYVRPVIGFETFRDAGVPALTAFPMRVQLNGAFSKVAYFLEQPDDRFLERVGLYPDGALYKMASDNPRMDNPNSMEKKNRDEESTRADLAAFFNGLHLTGPAQVKFIYDNVNIPLMLDYIAANILTGDNDDAQKNYFLYRDTNDGANAFYQYANPKGTNEWTMLPWDKDLTFGKNYGMADYQAKDPQAHPFFPDSNHPKIDGPNAWNWMIDALLDVPAIKQMYLRRLRTLMDQMLQPLGTPTRDRYYEQRLDELFAQLAGDPSFASSLTTLQQAFTDLKTKYLDARRVHLYVDHSINTAYPDYAGIPAQQNGSPTINFGAFDATPTSGNPDHEYLQLVNPNAVAVDISDWRLGGGVRYTFKKGTVIPAGGTLYVSPNVFAFRNRPGRSSSAIEYVVGNYDGQLSRLGETVTLSDAKGNPIATLQTTSAPSAAQQSLRVTEVMFHPPAPAAGSPYGDEDFEFVELRNVGASTLSLGGVKFTDGIYFDFTGSNVQSLAPGAYALVVANLAAFQSRYGNAFNGIIAGTFAPPPGGTAQSRLDNGGEHVRLADAQGETILAFDYDDGWYTQADGAGNSLVIRDPAGSTDAWDRRTGWAASAAANGSPGAADVPAVTADAVVINELLTNTTADIRGQWIELRNTTGAAIDVGGWYLSNDAGDLKKYRIAPGTILPANGYLVFTQAANFGNTADPGRLKAMSLDPRGATVYLTSATAGGAPSDYQASEKYGAATREVSLGRYLTSTGEKDFVPMAAPTFAAANASPAVGPVVINEVMYHPSAGYNEFIELRNITGAAVPLYDPANAQNTWKLTDGIDFTFPAGASIPANGYALVVKTDPAFFRSKYGIPAGVPIFGPYGKTLNNDGDTIELRRPADPIGGSVPYVRVDQVSFGDRNPWPVLADGWRGSLNRVTAGAYGDDVANWQLGRGTPGTASATFDTTPPSVPGTPTTTVVSGTQTNLSWSPASDPQSGVAFYYVYADGKRMAATAGTTFSDTWVVAGAPPRNYQISAVNGDGVESFLSGTVLAASVQPVTPDPRPTAVPQVTITFNGPVTGFDLADLTLTRDGGPNLLTAAQTLTTADNVTWTLGNLAGLTGTAGAYLLTLRAAGSGITSAVGDPLASDALDTWVVDQTAPTVSITPVAPDPRSATVDQLTIVFSEPIVNFDLTDLAFRRDGGANLLTASQTLTTTDGGTTWVLGNLGGLTNTKGAYQLDVIGGGGVTDLAGNALAAAGASESWVMTMTVLLPFDTTDDGLGTVTAQGENGTTESRLKAFDNQTSTKWLDFANNNPTTRASWIQYRYANAAKYVVTQYTITSANDAAERDPRDWQLLGSNDGGVTWTTVDSRTGETFTSRFQKRTFNVANEVAYNVYRLNILSVANPSAANSVQLAEIELIGLPPIPPTVTAATHNYQTGRTLSFQFSQNVGPSLDLADFDVKNLTTGQAVTLSGLSFDAPTRTVTLTFADLPDGNYTATLLAAGIRDANGNTLDGNADGTAGDAYTFPFYALAGDANHDRTVNFTDLLALAKNYNQSGKTYADGDFNYDGTVNFADLLALAKNYNKSLPAPGEPAAGSLVVTSSAPMPSLASVMAQLDAGTTSTAGTPTPVVPTPPPPPTPPKSPAKPAPSPAAKPSAKAPAKPAAAPVAPTPTPAIFGKKKITGR